ncbi:hypothetical protein HUG10_11965 [Halorarum halophilum]|uniref:Uncharacterized protein n=1 Tax=Halorarum halophilum TaxID=2743090 RepID=A0A7D5L2U5_9EURY|nr:DUF6789 family protein [Halobaculum halophilum]QLG28223.1 hypothetical protein HUG10_11965 [Halobaculum halophilum]
MEEENSPGTVQDVELGEEEAEPDFDHLFGVITDGFVGAVGGAVGTAIVTVGLLVARTFGAFEMTAFAELAEMTGTVVFYPQHPVAVGYFVFLAGGMVVWPLLFASAGSYLPGDRFATRGITFGAVIWTGFAMAFYDPSFWLPGYVFFTLVAHLGYGFGLGAVFDYLSTRPDTLV